MHVKTILNRVHPIKGFVYDECRFIESPGKSRLEVTIVPDRRSRPICSCCGKPAGTYDTQQQPRRFDFVPIWNIPVELLYCMRRVNCRRCGVKVERVPWSEGKEHTAKAYRCFLADWAKHLSWKTTAERFGATWDTVFRSVRWVVDWGLKNRDLDGIESIGVDEVQWHRGHKYLTLVYQIDSGCRRLLWVGKERTKESFSNFFTMLDGDQKPGERRSEKILHVCSDMWKAYLEVIGEKCINAIHILDRFHIKMKFTKAVDQVRRDETRRLKEDGYEPILKKSRWIFLKNRENLTEKQATKLGELVQINLRTVRAWLLKEEFERFWEYTSPTWAGKFLDEWCRRTMRSRLEPMKKVVGTLRDHRELIMNWFKAKELSSGVVEGMNNKVKLITHRSYGFRTFDAAEVALYHTLGDLPEPELTHRFC